VLIRFFLFIDLFIFFLQQQQQHQRPQVFSYPYTAKWPASNNYNPRDLKIGKGERGHVWLK
jgi:hypothetical protein